MSSQKVNRINIVYFIISYSLLWIILFEFIIPSNNILPKPSIVIDSFGALWKDYHLLRNFISSTASVYISIIAAYYLIRVLNKFLLHEKAGIRNFIFSIEWFSKYLPGIVLGFLLIYWFPQSEYIKYLFIFVVVFNSLLLKHSGLSGSINQDYIDAALSLGADSKTISNKVIWKSIQPDLMEHIFNSHLYFWAMLILFEFANYGNGFGSIFRHALEFKDLSALFAAMIILGIIIFIGATIIKLSKNKFFFWSGVGD
jgi:ABC-type nitrate/sulfonate/bicarbonate transport system permease component